MDVTKIPFFNMLVRRMDWLAQRQDVLAQNVANADTPGYRPRDLEAMDFRALVRDAAGTRGQTTRTHPAHLSIGAPQAAAFSSAPQRKTYETSLSGNAVVLEEQLAKVGETKMEHELATTIYRKYLGLFQIAIGRGGNS